MEMEEKNPKGQETGLESDLPNSAQKTLAELEEENRRLQEENERLNRSIKERLYDKVNVSVRTMDIFIGCMCVLSWWWLLRECSGSVIMRKYCEKGGGNASVLAGGCSCRYAPEENKPGKLREDGEKTDERERRL